MIDVEPGNGELCACGVPLDRHYTGPEVRRVIEGLIALHGESVQVQVQGEPFAVMVPRHFIAAHGIREADLLNLQRLYDWEIVPT